MTLPGIRRRMATAMMVVFMSSMALVAVCGQDHERTFEDLRDGKRYPTVKIGEQLWMGRNLDYAHPQSQCYEDDPGQCAVYGRLYAWEVAQEVCPEGWHLPSLEEWEELVTYLGAGDAGQQLKASGADPIPWDGTNASGFSALPAGAGNGEGFQRRGDWALFWTATSHGPRRACFAQLDGYWYEAPPKYPGVYLGNYYLKSNLFSVRCVQNE